MRRSISVTLGRSQSTPTSRGHSTLRTRLTIRMAKRVLWLATKRRSWSTWLVSSWMPRSRRDLTLLSSMLESLLLSIDHISKQYIHLLKSTYTERALSMSTTKLTTQRAPTARETLRWRCLATRLEGTNRHHLSLSHPLLRSHSLSTWWRSSTSTLAQAAVSTSISIHHHHHNAFCLNLYYPRNLRSCRAPKRLMRQRLTIMGSFILRLQLNQTTVQIWDSPKMVPKPQLLPSLTASQMHYNVSNKAVFTGKLTPRDTTEQPPSHYNQERFSIFLKK